MAKLLNPVWAMDREAKSVTLTMSCRLSASWFPNIICDIAKPAARLRFNP